MDARKWAQVLTVRVCVCVCVMDSSPRVPL
jgi:hypothetical protein